MTVAEAQAELDLLRAARTRILTGGIAEYQISGRMVRYLSLTDLDARDAVLTNIINQASASGGSYVARFRTPRY